MEKNSSVFDIPKKETIGEVQYTFKTSRGTVRITPNDILVALKEQSEKDYDDDIQPPNEDLQGWEIIHATDERGVSHPLFLMRKLPCGSHPPHGLFKRDDDAMGDIILKKVYNLSESKIKWIRFKNRVCKWFNEKVAKLFRS